MKIVRIYTRHYRDNDQRTAYVEQSTQAERRRMLDGGMIELSYNDWLARVALYGYRVERDTCFDYVNGANEIAYKARCVSNYVRISDGLGFAHVDGTRDGKFRALQQMRRDCFVFERGRIYEL